MSNAILQVKPDVQGEDPLRYAFVEMLFALAVSQVAIHAAELTTAKDFSWSGFAPAISHLVLSLVVIAASWVSWRKSQSPGMKLEIQSVFSRRFLALLLDVLLVVLYFILVRGIELQQKDGNTVLAPPSAVPEARWIAAIFGVYVVWDLLADVFSSKCLSAVGIFGRLWQGVRVAVVCTAASVFCGVLSLIIFVLASNQSGGGAVILLDLALMFLILLFRVLKVFERPLARRFGVEPCKAFASSRVVTGREKWLVLFLIAAYATAANLASSLHLFY